jgi:prenyltransferase beta subunit
MMMTYWMNYTLGGSSFQQGNYLEITNPTSCSSSFRTSSNDNSYITDNQVNIQLFSIMGVLINESIIERDGINNFLKGYSELSGVFILSTKDRSGKNDTRKIIFKP